MTMAIRELERPPRLTRLYGKAAVTGFLGGGDELPDTELVVPAVTIDRDHLAAYTRVCGFRFGDQLPITYPHVVAFPLAVELMADRSFPFPLVGLVHVANRIRQHRPIDASERLRIRVRAADLRPHPKGRQFDVVSDVEADGEQVWEETSTYLRRGAGEEGAAAVSLEQPEGRPATQWRVGADTGRRYAAVSGDRNPIHLHPLTARAFGFPRQIAHGMWTKARCLAWFEGRLPAAVRVEVAFKKPLVLPATVELAADPDAERWRFALRGRGGERVHLVGFAEPA